MSPVQRLVALVREITRQPQLPHTAQAVRTVAAAMRDVSLKNLGLDHHPLFLGHEQASTRKFGAPTIKYQHIFEDQRASVGIFLLPKHAVLPLHDHPNMTVVTLALFGTAHVTSYDWKRGEGNRTQRRAELVLDRDLNAGDVVHCHPHSNGNVHEIRSLTHFAMLDVIMPPYAEEEGRGCHYFEASKQPESDGAFAMREIPAPYFPLAHEPFRGLAPLET